MKEEKTILILVGSMERIMVMRLSILVVDLELVRIDLVPIMEELVQWEKILTWELEILDVESFSFGDEEFDC